MAGTIQNAGKNLMVDSVGQLSGMYLTAWEGTGTTLIAASTSTVAFASSSGGVADITGDATIAIPSGKTVVRVKLANNTAGSVVYASDTVSYTFTNGGDLIVESYEISVT